MKESTSKDSINSLKSHILTEVKKEFDMVKYSDIANDYEEFSLKNINCGPFTANDIKHNDGLIQIILRMDQVINCACEPFVRSIASRLSKEANVKVDNGDGDEGCIYIEM